MSLNRQVQFVHQDKPEPGQAIASVAVFDADGNPIDITGGSDAPTTIPQGALIPGAGINLTRDNDSGVITASVKDKGITAGMLADGVAVSGPKGDKGDTGPAGPKGDKGDPGAVPGQATPNVLGTVKQAAFIADPAGDTPTKAEYVALRDALVTAGIMAPKA